MNDTDDITVLIRIRRSPNKLPPGHPFLKDNIADSMKFIPSIGDVNAIESNRVLKKSRDINKPLSKM